ncbi:MAG: TerB family tellurite resistance protein [Candidatus Pseudobacter hemicellulosilyticus]|uniref:TerB family tellurite resistance protein n=1 Tax=Candidatus Pseudobacter hemicellulosilyticus TaxID=3121375 RepID=A0AAJ5WSY5_9BACT|nr:MAG: TerB family tellurite resistance protein [Pseudobacter sp.]
MRHIGKCVLLVLVGFMGSAGRLQAQADEIAQLLLNVEKLAQFKAILDDMKKGYDILNGGYNTVKNLTQGNFSIHKIFLDGLLAVSPQVANYRKVPVIIQNQIELIREYRNTLKKIKGTAVFRTEELDYLERVYGNLLRKSLQHLDELTLVITAGQLRMSDEERLRIIDRIDKEMSGKLQFLREFNAEASLLAMQRAKEKGSADMLRALYGQ